MQTWTITLTNPNPEQAAADNARDFGKQEFTIADLIGSLHQDVQVSVHVMDDFNEDAAQTLTFTADEFAARFL